MEGFIIEVELDVIQANPKYAETLLKSILNKSRVDRIINSTYIENLNSSSELYLGGLRIKNGEIVPIFDKEIAKIILDLNKQNHNTDSNNNTEINEHYTGNDDTGRDE